MTRFTPPPPGWGLNSASSLLRGLVEVARAVPNGWRTYVRPAMQALTGGSIVYTNGGLARQHMAASDKAPLSSDGSRLPTGPITILLYGSRVSSTLTDTQTFANYESLIDGPPYPRRLVVAQPWSADGRLYWDYGGVDEGVTRLSVGGLSWPANTPMLFIYTAGPRGMEVWKDGVLLASNTANPTRTASTGEWGHIPSPGDSSQTNVRHHLTSVWNRQLSPAEIRALSADPWQLFSSGHAQEVARYLSTIPVPPGNAPLGHFDYSGVLNINQWLGLHSEVKAWFDRTMVAEPTSYVPPPSPPLSAITWSPTSKFSSIVLSNNNLTIRSNISGVAAVRTSQPAQSAKWYAELTVQELTGNFLAFGVCDQGFDVTSATPFSTVSRVNVRSDGGGTFDDGVSVGPSPNTAVGGIGMLAYDDTAGRLYVGYNGTWLGGADPAAGTGGMAVTFASGLERYIYAVLQTPTQQLTANFAGPFTYSVPSGFAAFSPASGSTHSSSVLETTTAGDSCSATVIRAVSMIEIVAAADGFSSALTANVNQAESTQAGDAVTASKIATVDVVEGVVADESSTTAGTPTADVVESVAASESSSSLKIATASQTEATTAGDFGSSNVIAQAFTIESLSAGDISTAGSNMFVSISENTGTSDSSSSGLIIGVSLTENVSATDLSSVVKQAVASVSESVAATDLAVATANYQVSRVESAAATDSSSATTQLIASVIESVAAGETNDGVRSGIVLLSISESLTATDTASAGVIRSASVVEAVVAFDQAVASQFKTGTVTESVNATDLSSFLINNIAHAVESVMATESSSVGRIIPVRVIEEIVASEINSASAIFKVSRIETISAGDSSSATKFGNLPALLFKVHFRKRTYALAKRKRTLNLANRQRTFKIERKPVNNGTAVITEHLGEKTPQENIDYRIDFTDWDWFKDGDTITSTVLTRLKGDVVLGGSSGSGKIATVVLLPGGTAGKQNKLSLRINTTNGRSFEVFLTLQMVS